MVVQLTCRSCGVRVKTADSNVGRAMRCPRCRSVTVVDRVIRPPDAVADDGEELSQPRQRASLRDAVGYGFVLLLLGTVCFWFTWRALERRDGEISGLRQQLSTATESASDLRIENRRLHSELDAITAGPERTYERAAARARDGRYVEARDGFSELIALYPSHELVAQARSERARMERVITERNLSATGITVGGVRSGWVAVGPAGAPARAGDARRLQAPTLSLHIRNASGTKLEGVYVRADFIVVGGGEKRVLGDGFVPLAAVLEPDMSAEVRLTSLGTIDADGAGDALLLPRTEAHVFVKLPGEAFRRVGVFDVERVLIDGD